MIQWLLVHEHTPQSLADSRKSHPPQNQNDLNGSSPVVIYLNVRSPAQHAEFGAHCAEPGPSTQQAHSEPLLVEQK